MVQQFVVKVSLYFQTVLFLGKLTQHPDYAGSGLLEPSVIRLGFLAVLPTEHIKGAIGMVSSATYSTLVTNLTRYLLTQ